MEKIGDVMDATGKYIGYVDLDGIFVRNQIIEKPTFGPHTPHSTLLGRGYPIYKNYKCHAGICKKIRFKRGYLGHRGMGGITLAVIHKQMIMLGRDTRDKNYGFCNGKLDIVDDGCFVKAAIRELKEEFKIDLSWSDFYEKCKDSNGMYRM